MSNFTVWVILETAGPGLRDCALEALGEGRSLADNLSGRVHAVLLGSASPALLDQVTRQDVDEIYILEHHLLANSAADEWVAALAGLFKRFSNGVILFSATPLGHETSARLALRLGAPIVSGCVWIKAGPERDILLVRPTHAGKFQVTYACLAELGLIASLQPGIAGIAPPVRFRQPVLQHIPAEITQADVQTRQITLIPGDPKKIDLREAERIVAGGGGACDPEAWRILENLAEALDAAVGGSRVAMDAGRVPRSRMIGQSGATVKPRLYVAAGISGAPQHLNGVQTEHLLAINIDRSAAIFKNASLGIVGDCKVILEKLAERIRKGKKESRPSGGLK